MFKKEVIDQQWMDDDASLAIIMSFYVYNPNLFMIDEKRIVIEFLEPGGFINMEHESLLINMKLYRETGQVVQSVIILILGMAVVSFSLFDIIKENKEVVNEVKNEEEQEGDAEAEEINE